MAVTLPTKLVAEFVGTFLLVFTVGCNVLGAVSVWSGVSIASVLMVSIYALGGISGGNFNPAVTFSLLLATLLGKENIMMDLTTAFSYTVVQIFAGIVAAMSYSQLYGDTFSVAPAKEFGWMETGLCELLYTFMLCFVVLNVATADKLASNQFYGLAIGSVIIAGAYGAGAVSGGCFNPAVAIGVDTASMTQAFGWCLLYTAFELVGAMLATFLFYIVRPEDFDRDENAIAPFICEFVGTYMLVLTVGLNVLGGSAAGAYSIAAALMSMIYALGDISGAHFNPAVTVAILVSGRVQRLTLHKASVYIVMQILGGCLGALTYSYIRNGDSFGLGPNGNIHWAQIAVAEFMFTFVLCYVVLCVAVSEATKATVFFGFAIGACVTVGGNAIGSVSGGSLNPAVSVGIAASHEAKNLLNALVYSGAELLAGIAAAGVFTVTHAHELVKN